MELLRLLFRNALRHKLRSLLTILGVGVAVMAFALLRTVVSAWHAGVEASSANRLITRHAVSFVFPLPLAYRDRIAQVPGVENVTYATWFSGVYIDKNQFFGRLAVDSETFFEVYPEFLIPKDQFDTFKRERNACIIGVDLARRYNLKLGDIMNVEGDVYPGSWEFVVRGIYRPRDQTTDPATMMFHYKYVDERVRLEMPERSGEVGWYIVRIRDPENSAAVSEAIDRLFANSRAETKTETERLSAKLFVIGQRRHYGHEYHVVPDHRHHIARGRQYHDHVCARADPRVRRLEGFGLFRPALVFSRRRRIADHFDLRHGSGLVGYVTGSPRFSNRTPERLVPSILHQA